MTPAQWEGRSCAAFSCVFCCLFSAFVLTLSLALASLVAFFRSLLCFFSRLIFSLSFSLKNKNNSLIGPKVDYAVGYQQFSTALPSPTPIANALLTPLRGAGQRLLEKVGALAAKKVLRGVPVGGGVGGGGAATSTTAAVDGARQG